MVLKLFSTMGVPGTFSGKMYKRMGAWYCPHTSPFALVFAAGTGLRAVAAACPCKPSITDRISRGAGKKVFAAFITHSLSTFVGTEPKGKQGGRKRQRPFTAP